MTTARVVTTVLVMLLARLAIPMPASLAQPPPVPTDTAGPAPNETPVGSPPIREAQESDEPFEGGAPVIQAGQEEILADMLGRGVELAGGCKFAGGGADPAAIHSTYTCGAGEVVVELRHPSSAPAGAVQTAQFAVIVRSGSPPAGFLESLAARIRQHETGFHWKWLGQRSSGRSRSLMLLGLGAIVALAVVAWVLRRRGSPRGPAPPG